MAHDYRKGPSFLYNGKGGVETCYSEGAAEDAKKRGFTSTKYVKVEWPAEVYEIATGKSKQAKSEEEFKALGDGWTKDPVFVPEKKATPAVSGLGSEDALVKALLNQNADLLRRVERLEQAPDITQAVVDVGKRVSLLEAVLNEPEPAGKTSK